MSVTYVGAGALAASATSATLPISAPACNADDILVCALFLKASAPECVGQEPAGWAPVDAASHSNGTNRICLFWKRAVGGDSGASFTFGKDTDDNLLFAGIISAWRGATATGNPFDSSGTPSYSDNASSDTVTYATLDPAAKCHILAFGFYNNDLTTAGTISGTNPAYTNRFDVETGTGTDCSIFCYSGDSDGAATGSRSHSTTSTADAISIGMQVGLLEAAQVSTPASVVLSCLIGAATVLAGTISSSPASVALDLAVPAAAVSNGNTVQPLAVALSAAIGVPVVVAGPISSTPASTALATAESAPTVVAGGVSSAPAAVPAGAAVSSPAVVAGIVLSAPASTGLSASVPDPTVTGGGGAGGASSTPASVDMVAAAPGATGSTTAVPIEADVELGLNAIVVQGSLNDLTEEIILAPAIVLVLGIAEQPMGLPDYVIGGDL